MRPRSFSGDGIVAPHEHLEQPVIQHLNRQDGYLMRRTCQTRRTELGSRTTRLILAEEVDDAVLPSVNLRTSFPGVTSLVLRCCQSARDAWPDHFCAFVLRNMAVLENLRELDMGYNASDAPAASTGVLNSLAVLKSLERLSISFDWIPPSWATLRHLEHLTSLQLTFRELPISFMHDIAAAAPQLRALAFHCGDDGWFDLPNLWHISELRRLRSLTLELDLTSNIMQVVAQLLRRCTGLWHLTCMNSRYSHDVKQPVREQMLAAVGSLRNLRSLKLDDSIVNELMPLHALASLTELTHIDLGVEDITCQQAMVLGSMESLESVAAKFSDGPTLQAAGLHTKQALSLRGLKWPINHMHRSPVQLTGSVELLEDDVYYFDLSSVACLVLKDGEYWDGREREQLLSQTLLRCSGLKALHLQNVPSTREVMEAVAACSELEHLYLEFPTFQHQQSLTLGLLAPLRRLKQLTLKGCLQLCPGTVVGIMLLPRLRLLRLLACTPGISQDDAQGLVGTLGRYELQVDVVPDDGSVRAGWVIGELSGRWREV